MLDTLEHVIRGLFLLATPIVLFVVVISILYLLNNVVGPKLIFIFILCVLAYFTSKFFT